MNTQQGRSSNDQRSDVKNPNSSAFKANADNRSNQMNPNNPNFAGGSSQNTQSKTDSSSGAIKK